MSSIKINSGTSLNLDELIVSKLLVQANSGGGKSWLLRRILEQSHGKVQQI
ncbi:MAG TPA: ATP-binding protein, partial [Candidatus Paceibacterota bacterium]|nr:ATP-binding protein [Candidatus Paceibacterota bacterium]